MTDLPMHFKQQILMHARNVEGAAYHLWLKWKDSKNPKTRSLALVAKCRGIVAFDRFKREFGL